ncbi:MAG: hypothetical protein RIS36_1703 [Pseudomonadota bacterium]|jgi:hypothetical protein
MGDLARDTCGTMFARQLNLPELLKKKSFFLDPEQLKKLLGVSRIGEMINPYLCSLETGKYSIKY